MKAYSPPTSPFLDILHEEENFLVLNKPSGLLTVPGRGPDKHDSLLTRVKSLHPSAEAVHRLDMETSGLVVVPKSKHSLSKIARAFQERRVEKLYIAWVYGNVEQDYGEIDLPLIADWPNRPKQKVDFEVGKEAITKYEVLERTDYGTSLALMPRTGRSHQLRVHLAEIGHPILGDQLYAHQEALLKSNRLMLHAQKLSFKHPETDQTLLYEAPLPF